MLFRQLYEPESSTYTYLIGCEETGECVLIDPVLEAAERDLTVVQELDLRLAMTIETHIHADHVSSAARLRSLTGCKVAYPAMEGLACADIGIKEGEPVAVGSLSLRPLFTPGHTDTHHSYLLEQGGQRPGQAMGLNVFTLFTGFGLGALLFGEALRLGFDVAFGLFALTELALAVGALRLFRSEMPKVGAP